MAGYQSPTSRLSHCSTGQDCTWTLHRACAYHACAFLMSAGCSQLLIVEDPSSVGLTWHQKLHTRTTWCQATYANPRPSKCTRVRSSHRQGRLSFADYAKLMQSGLCSSAPSKMCMPMLHDAEPGTAQLEMILPCGLICWMPCHHCPYVHTSTIAYM